MEDLEFEVCIRQIREGDKEGLKQIYQAYAGLIYAVVYDVTRHEEDAKDITSECFIRLWERADTYRFGGKHRAWLVTIARNMAIDHLRKQRREMPMEELPEAEQEVLDLKILGDFTFREISKILRKPMGTVSWLYRSGIEKLRKYHQVEQEVRE